VARYSAVGASRLAIIERARRALQQASVTLVPEAARDNAWRERAAKAIYRWITRTVDYKYDPDGTEQVQEPVATLSLGEGDCDDLVSLSIAMLKTVGVPARIVVIRQTGSDVFNHIYAQYKGATKSGDGDRWKPFDVTLDQTGGPAAPGDGPSQDIIAEKVVIPVRLAHGPPASTSAMLGPETKRALEALPADAGVVHPKRLKRERAEAPGEASGARADALADGASHDSQNDSPKDSPAGMAKSIKFFPSTEGRLIGEGAAPGTISATRSIARRAASEPEKKTVVVIDPDQYERLVKQRLQSGNYVCDTQNRIIIRDEAGREILPFTESPPSESDRTGADGQPSGEGAVEAGLPGGLGFWVVGGLAVGAMMMGGEQNGPGAN
jgi:hypothetical protein